MWGSYMKKKVCIVFHSPDRYNGATRSLLDLIETWKEDRDLELICVLPREGSALGLLNSYKIKTYLFNYYDVRYYSTARVFDKIVRNSARRARLLRERFVEVNAATKKLKKENIDIVYSNTGSIFFGIWLSKALNVPHFWHIREMGEEDQNAKMLLGKKYFMKLLNESQCIITISECVKAKYEKYLCTDTQMIRLYNDISSTNIDYCERQKNLPLKVLIVGSIIEGKGHEQVIRAIAELRRENLDLELYISGKNSGSYYERMKSLVNELGSSNYVHFLGHVSDMKTLKRQMHLEIVASKCEAFGRITVEAMLAGLPLIGANTGCTKELITHNKNGLLYSWGDVSDLSEKINYAYENYNVMVGFARNAFAFSKQFTVGNTASEIKKLLCETR